ncbi:uncharacterized protein BJ212DRAFT_1588637 [Suillus subaureus]|uniref:O-methyltransferase domain-containing protein n=1 Tax=Suillus subaureus TaxID=48587 RepID=A0A9P7JBP8_9AGAM|nr:uncharacterized protein BJ212DRAFT_1588637 [Suillus subaureus]KAG1813660.1 hypothetical protein BJ212DRAFT_1588637 [Suillus subaureus]
MTDFDEPEAKLEALLSLGYHQLLYTFAFKKAMRLLEGISLEARVADVLDQHLEGLSVDKLAEAVNLDEIEIARVLRALTLMGCFKEGRCLKRRPSFLRYYDRLARSREVDNAPRLFGLQKRGMKGNNYEVMRDNEKKCDDFHRAMLGHSVMMGSSAVLHDVGSGIGASSTPLAAMFLHIRITDQDLPEVMLRNIIHMWSDAEAAKILRNICKAMGPNN